MRTTEKTATSEHEEIEKAAKSAVLTNNLTQIQVLSLAIP